MDESRSLVLKKHDAEMLYNVGSYFLLKQH